jgi:hypothetical protein
MMDDNIRETGHLDISGIGHNEFGAFFLGPEDTPGNERMARGRIRTDDKNTSRIFKFGNGIGHGPTSKCSGKTCHRGGMSEPGAVIHIVGPDHCSGKFLGQVILFIGDFCGSQHTDTIRPMVVNDALEFVGRYLYGLVPCDFL